MPGFFGYSLRLIPAVFLRLLPVYVVYLFMLFLIFGTALEPFVRAFLVLIVVFPSTALLVLSALRAGLIHSRQTEAVFPQAVSKMIVRLVFIQGLMALIIQFIIFFPILLYLDEAWGLPLFQNQLLAFEGLMQLITTGQAALIHPGYAYAIACYAIPFAVSSAILAAPMAGTAAMAVRKPPMHDAVWGFGSRTITLFLFYAPVALCIWGGLVIAVSDGLISYFFSLTQNSLLAFVLPWVMGLFIWLPVFAAGASTAYAHRRLLDTKLRDIMMQSYTYRVEENTDIGALRRARQSRQHLQE